MTSVPRHLQAWPAKAALEMLAGGEAGAETQQEKQLARGRSCKVKYKSLAETCFCYLSMETAPGETPWLIFSAYKTQGEFRHRLPRGQAFTLPVLNSHLEPESSARGCSTNTSDQTRLWGPCLLADLTAGHLRFHYFT